MDPRRHPRPLARRLVDAAAIVLAVAGLLAFVLAPLFSGPRPWPGGKAIDPPQAAKAPDRGDARAESN